MKFVTIIIVWVVSKVSGNIANQTRPIPSINNGEDSPNVRSFAYLEIFRQDDFGGPTMYFGGGVLINSWHVLTVAQNVEQFKSWRIGMGSNRIADMQWSYSTHAIIHPEYNSADLANNIAVLRLVELVENSANIGPIFLLNGDIIKEGGSCEMAGFGFREIKEQPQFLQRTELTIISEEACGDAYPHLRENGQLQNHFCAHNLMVNSNMCAGDQGGPIYMPMGNLLLGITSFNRVADCHLPESLPPAFLQIPPYIDWINSIVTIN